MSTEGVRGFYRGFGTTIMREVSVVVNSVVRVLKFRQIPFTSLQFPLYELLKARLAKALGRPLHAYEAAVCGSFAGGVAAAATTPLDVLKTRVMLDIRVSLLNPHPTAFHSQVVNQDPSKHEYPTLAARFRSIYVNEGVGALFAGVVPRTL